VFNVAGDANQKVEEISVGEDPRFVTIAPDGKTVYVSNSRSGTVSEIDADSLEITDEIEVGTEPAGLAVTPDGKRLFVANFSSRDVAMINVHSGHVQKRFDVGAKPRAIAIVGDKVYVTEFLAQLRDDGRSAVEKEGRDDGKEGRVSILSAKNFKRLSTVVLNPLADTGFRSNGSVLDRIGATDPATFTFVTGAFPNLLESIVIKHNRAYLPNVGSSPNGPVRFNVNVQGLLSVFNTDTDQDSGQTINMNSGVQFEAQAKKLFITTPIAIAFKHNSDEGFVVAAGIDRIVRVVLDANGKPTINAPTNATDPGNVIRIAVGTNPQGIVINSSDTRAYVMNFISRDLSVVDISGAASGYHEIVKVPSASLPAPGTLEAIIHRGNELFNESIGPAGTA
jgi:YVTN family beta-propeller protein